MPDFPPALERLIQELTKLPGIGPKSAQRMAFHLLRNPEGDVRAFAEALVEARRKLRRCKECFNWTEQDVCRICTDDNRDASALLVVEDAADVAAFERLRSFRGRYHVLGGVLSPLEGKGPETLTLEALRRRLEKNNSIKEVILATDPTVEGDTTALYIQDVLKDLPVKVTRLARGLPSGGEVDYADEATLLRALEGRREI